MSVSPSRGKAILDTLQENLRALRRGFAHSDHERPVILDVTPNGQFVNGMTLDIFVARVAEIFRESGRVYQLEDSLVYEYREAASPRLQVLSIRGEAAANADAVLANSFTVGVQSEKGEMQGVAGPRLVGALLADETLCQNLPVIKVYAQRAVFDSDFRLCGPGWHPEQGILVHGPDIMPAQQPHVAPAGTSSIDRLPPFLRRLLQDFCWASESDLENALALLLTGLLVNHFVVHPKPVGLIDGNQQEIGKTLLCQAIGQVLDGQEPERIPLVKDEELEKKIGAKLRESRSSIFFFDNIRTRLESAFIEANCASPLLSVRLLGHSRNINRPNSYLWLITSNLTSGSSDMITRGIPIRLRFEGDPVTRTFHENLLEFVARHRMDILGELAAMVLNWQTHGRPAARDIWPAGRPAPRHRWDVWCQTIGGILGANGFFSFLANVSEAKAAMDEGLQTLASLAEHAVTKGQNGFFNPPDNDPERGKLPREWANLFTAASLCKDKLADKNAKGRDTWVGTFLSGKTDRVVSITVGTDTASAVLRRNPTRGDQKRYYFEITTTAPATPSAPPGGPAADVVVPTAATAPTVDSPAAAASTTDGTAPEGGNGLEWL